MFELPEFATLARQINQVLTEKVIAKGSLGNSPHKFVWYNRTHDEFAALTQGKTIGEVSSKGKWLFVSLQPGYVLVLGECGGKVLYHHTVLSSLYPHGTLLFRPHWAYPVVLIAELLIGASFLHVAIRLTGRPHDSAT